MKHRYKQSYWPWFVPLATILILFYLFPLLDTLRLSFTTARMGTMDADYSLASYAKVFVSPDLGVIIRNTVIFVFLTVLLQLSMGLGVGMLLNTELPGMNLLKLAMITAWVMPGIIGGIVWNLLYSSASWGSINNTLALFGIDRISFLTKPRWALSAIIITNTWRGTGFSGLIQYGALRAIDPSLYEAASIDGASAWDRFRNITLPMLRPMLMINVILITIASVNTYDTIWSLSKGGPGIATTVLSLQTYKITILRQSISQGAVYAVLMIVFSLVFTALYLSLQNKGKKQR